MNNLTDLFRDQQKQILLYMGIETVKDTYEKNVTMAYINPITINGIVSDMSSTRANYKMPGIMLSKAKEILIESRYLKTIEVTQKIRISGDSDYYEGYRINGKLQYREEGDFIRLFIYTATVDMD